MTTGLHYDFNPPNDPIYYEAPDRLKLAATTTPLLEPGKVFQYMDVNPILATAMLSQAAGKKLEDYADEKLFKPLGMKHYAWVAPTRRGSSQVAGAFACGRSTWRGSACWRCRTAAGKASRSRPPTGSRR